MGFALRNLRANVFLTEMRKMKQNIATDTALKKSVSSDCFKQAIFKIQSHFKLFYSQKPKKKKKVRT